MTTANVAYSVPRETPGARLLRAGLLTGIADAIWATVLTLIYGRTFVQLWQGVAAVPFGPSMNGGGVSTVVLGLVVHFTVAFTWSAVLLVLVLRWEWLRALLDSPGGPLKIAVWFGPLIWTVMSMAVIPLMTHKLPAVTYRWWIQAAGHVVFVGLPMAWGIRRRPSPDAR